MADFAVLAPLKKRVRVLVDNREHEMALDHGGWWRVDVPDAGVGAAYAWRESGSSLANERSEVTGFVTLPGGQRSEVQLYATKGLSNGSPDWGAGVAFTAGF